MGINFRTIATPEAAADALRDLQHANREQLHEAVSQILEGLAHRPPPPVIRLHLAEVLREHGDDVISRYRVSYNDRPLPLGEEESMRFRRAMDLLEGFERLYFGAYADGATAPAGDPVRVELGGALQRAMACIVAAMIEHYRARQTVGPALWKRLQQYMQTARADGLENAEIIDPLNPSGAGAPLSTYSRALLLSIAQAGAMAYRSLEATLALTGLFANLVETVMLDSTVDAGAAAEREAVAGVDIQRNGRIRIVNVAGVTHLVNTKKISDALNWCVSRLGEGDTPEQIGLGSVAKADLSALLPRLQRIWCGAGDIREDVRQGLQEASHIAIGFHEIHAAICPDPIVIPKEFEVYASGPFDQPATAGAVLPPESERVPTERWQILDHSSSGMRARREHAGARLRRGQILGVDLSQINPSRGIALAEVRWLQQFAAVDGGGIAAGVRFLSTRAHPALVRTFRLVRERYQDIAPAFVLDAGGETRLALPAGWFAPGRVVDLWYREELRKLELVTRISQGVDYEIVACRKIP